MIAEEHLHWQAFVVFRWNTNEAPQLRFDRTPSDMSHKGIEYVVSLDVLATGLAKNSLQKVVRLGLPDR